MTLKVIGAGLGRTGTLSLKLALEHLGFGPCYHAMEIPMAEFRPIPLWCEAIEGRADWDLVFAGYQSTADYPGCCFWPELIAHYPDAKVILTLRDPDSWFESISATLFSPTTRPLALAGPMGPLNRHFTRGIPEELLGDRATMTAHFRRWNQSVIDGVPAARLLVFAVQDGWEPLCRFLGVPVPDVAYPRVNSRDELNVQLQGAPATMTERAARMRAHVENLRRMAFATGGTTGG